MATNGTQQAFSPDEVFQAMQTMRGSDLEKKKKAHEYLESFQKSVCYPVAITAPHRQHMNNTYTPTVPTELGC